VELHSSIATQRIVVVLRGLDTDRVLEAAAALRRGGIQAFEVTMNSPNAIRSIERLCDTHGDEAYVGAGTVTRPGEVDDAATAGARYIVSPNLDLAVVERTKDQGLVSIPGALTPTEVLLAARSGADLVKVFPVMPAGGAAYVRQLRGPYDDLPILASGGVTYDAIPSLFSAGVSAIALGVPLMLAGRSEGANLDKLEEAAADFLEATKCPSEAMT